jgi:hypothetical protein
MWESAIDEVIDAAILVLSEELREIVRERGGVGSNSRVKGGALFRNSTLNSAMENYLLNWPDNSVITGDDAFPLRNASLKTYSTVNLTLKQKIFNYHLSRARRDSENAFGILAERFRVFGRPIELKVSTIDLVIRSACCLHNWLRMTSSNYISMGCLHYEDLDTGTFKEGHWRAEGNLGISPLGILLLITTVHLQHIYKISITFVINANLCKLLLLIPMSLTYH